MHGLAERLERGDVVYFPSCPFELFQDDDHRFLLEQRLASRVHKNISYDPATGRAGGFAHQSAEQAERLRRLLASFSNTAVGWLASVIPAYQKGWKLDRVSYRPEEEATRQLRHKARNDLLHVDAFPTRPTNGWRILRLFVNVNPSEPRVWVTSDPFARLLERYGKEVGLPGQRLGLGELLLSALPRLFRPGRKVRSPYDSFMRRMHDYLKSCEEFQERSTKRLWSFPPFSLWLAITDTASHAVLRGRYALEQTFFIDPATLALPDESPAALLAKACGHPVLRRAA
jgi:hypothetical protein